MTKRSELNLRQPADLPTLCRLSARIGADPLLIQGAGGNTSIKDGPVMWIKASGTLLADAETREIFVPVDLPAMRAAMLRADPIADQPAAFALAGTLRPSIETSLHAVFSQRVVVHVHCVNTLAFVIRRDAHAAVSDRLQGFNWAFAPYFKPGAELAGAVAAVLGPNTDVVLLANHGLIIAAESVAAAEDLLSRVVGALDVAALDFRADLAALEARAGDGFVPLPSDHPLHGVAVSAPHLSLAMSGCLYPDHVIFCGGPAVALGEGEAPAQAVACQIALGLPPPVFLLVPGRGALADQSASSGALALMRCLGDVVNRVPAGAEVNVLTDAEFAALLDWDAEKYRQALNAT